MTVLVGDARPPAYDAADGVGDTERKSLALGSNAAGEVVWAHSDNFFSYRGAEEYDGVVATQENGVPFFYAAGMAEAGWGNFTAVLAKYTADGALLWTRQLGVTGSSLLSGGYGVAELNGNIYVSGITWYPSNNADTARTQLWKYSESGTPLWERSVPGFGGYVAAADGGIYLASALGRPAEPKDVQVLKYDEAGTVLWSRTWGGTGSDIPYGLATDGTRLFVTGETNSFGSGGKDLFLQELDTAHGLILGTQFFAGTQDDMGNGVAIRDDELYVVGSSRSFATGGNAPGESDVMLLQYALSQAPATAVTQVTVNNVAPVVDVGAGGSESLNANRRVDGRSTVGGQATFAGELTSVHGRNFAGAGGPLSVFTRPQCGCSRRAGAPRGGLAVGASSDRLGSGHGSSVGGFVPGGTGRRPLGGGNGRRWFVVVSGERRLA